MNKLEEHCHPAAIHQMCTCDLTHVQSVSLFSELMQCSSDCWSEVSLYRL